MIKLSFLNLFRRKSRTLLAILGVMVGVAAIIVLVSLVDGVLFEFDSLLSQIQGVFIMEKDTIDQSLSYVDTSFKSKLESVYGVRTVVPEIYFIPTKVDGSTAGEDPHSAVYGMYMAGGYDFSDFSKLRGGGYIGDVKEGSWIKPGDDSWVVLGRNWKNDRDKFLGSSIKVNGKKFRVKGFLEAESSSWGDLILMTEASARELSGISSSKVNSYYIELVDPSKDKAVAEKIEFLYGEDLEILTSSQMSETYGGLLGDFRLLVFLVAAISAVVAGVGIMNTILMSVLERSPEIGSLKATGWTNSNVMRMILYESAFIGIFGGALGLVFGFFVDVLIEATTGVGYLISPALLMQAFGFALFMGLFSGIYPAYRASKLDPVKAIHGGF